MTRRGKRSAYEAVGEIQRQLRDRWSKAANLRVREGDWAVHIFREHNKEGDGWAEKKVLVALREWEDEKGVVWPNVTGSVAR